MQGMKNDLKKNIYKKGIKAPIVAISVFGFLMLAMITLLLVSVSYEEDFDEYGAIVIIILLGLIILGNIKSLISVLKTTPYTYIKKICKKTSDPAGLLARLEKTWAEGYDFGEGRIDKEYIIIIHNHLGRVMMIEDAVWVYYDINGILQIQNDFTKNSTLIMKGGYMGSLFEQLFGTYFGNMSNEATKKIFNYIKENKPDVFMGKTEEAERLYSEGDMEGLKALARKQRL